MLRPYIAAEHSQFYEEIYSCPINVDTQTILNNS